MNNDTSVNSAASGEYASRPVVLQASNLSKTFRIPHDRKSTLKQRVIRPKRQTFETLRALDVVDFEVHAGEFFGIVGRNGSGKSTLLKCMAGIYKPNAGEVRARGRMATFIELGVGFNHELSARDNVEVNATLLGLTPQVARDRFDEIIAFAELEEFVDMKLKNYSSGMQVRLAFSVAVHVEADVLLIDEVLAVGDAAFQQKCFDTFERLRDEGRTVILVTHDMETVKRMCTRALMLERGKIVSQGNPDRVAGDYLDINFDRSAQVGESESHRWGDGRAKVEECWFENDAGERITVLPQGDWVTFKSRVKFNEAMHAPIFGTTIRDSQKRSVFVTNTMWDRSETGEFAAGETCVYVLRFQNHLDDGRYFVSPAVAHTDGLQMADSREDFVTILVSGERRTGGSVNLPHESSVEHGLVEARQTR